MTFQNVLIAKLSLIIQEQPEGGCALTPNAYLCFVNIQSIKR
ncbi:hypothetical protein PORCRE_522 [Porphyromonas crevioricanis JCM 15906]|uniref:Uncharacterized protein n=1 Tax=Porphyromonas crevioricanis JCM 15906 TaxID=1305617 RepID=S4PGM9_9PORP|nr:hypothetical protein PORCRE_522 [Porphyromonas crevioricanis JCM 15906]GAD08097.1 hypothetical protein PORCAN_1732 [Porphyromonas crevioricanis JCM 13913]